VFDDQGAKRSYSIAFPSLSPCPAKGGQGGSGPFGSGGDIRAGVRDVVGTNANSHVNVMLDYPVFLCLHGYNSSKRMCERLQAQACARVCVCVCDPYSPKTFTSLLVTSKERTKKIRTLITLISMINLLRRERFTKEGTLVAGKLAHLIV
jgi:hypothetical protein